MVGSPLEVGSPLSHQLPHIGKQIKLKNTSPPSLPNPFLVTLKLVKNIITVEKPLLQAKYYYQVGATLMWHCLEVLT